MNDNQEYIDVIKNLSTKCVLNIEYNNLGNFKKDIYFTNCPAAIDFLIQCQKLDKDFKLNVPKETKSSIVGFDCKEKRFVKLYTGLINSVCLPYLDNYNPAALQHCMLTPEQQQQILNDQAPILEGTVCKVETSKIAIDCPNLDYVVNVENALKILEISKTHINSKNPKVVGKCKKLWLEKILESKESIIKYLKREKETSDSPEDIDFIIQKLDSYDYKMQLFGLHTPLEIAQYWPDLLNPKPDFVIGFDSLKTENETKKMVLDRCLDFVDSTLTFMKYRVFGFIDGQFHQNERAVGLKQTEDGLLFYCFPLDRNTCVSGDYGISNVYFVYYLHFNRDENGQYNFNTNLLGQKQLDWKLVLSDNGDIEVKSEEDKFELKFIKTEDILTPKDLLKSSIVFQNN